MYINPKHILCSVTLFRKSCRLRDNVKKIWLSQTGSQKTNTGLFISPSGISNPCGTVAGMVTPKGSMSTEQRETHSKFMSYLTGARYVHPWWCGRCQILAKSKTQTAYLFPVHAMFCHDCPPSGETCKYATAPSTKKTWRDSLSIDMLLSAVSVLVVAQSSSEIAERLTDYPV
jgi:hypothetical protein